MTEWVGPHRLGNGRWRGYVDDAGTRRYASGQTRTAAVERLRALAAEVEAGVVARGTVEHWVDQTVEAANANGQPPAEGTLESRRYIASLIPPWFATMKVSRVTADDADDALLEVANTPAAGGKQRSRNTVGKVRSTLMRAFDRAVRKDALARNVIAQTDSWAERRGEPTWLDVDQARKVLDGLAGHPWLPIYIVMATLGLRRGELLGLRWDYVDLEAGTVRIRWTVVKTPSGKIIVQEATKTSGSRRTIRLPTYTRQVLASHADVWRDADAVARGDDGVWVWSGLGFGARKAGTVAKTPHGLPSPDSLDRPLAAACERAGVPVVSPHGLRHSAATIMLAAGVDSRAVMDVLGHVDHRMTSLYQHVLDAVRERTAEQLDDAWGVG